MKRQTQLIYFMVAIVCDRGRIVWQWDAGDVGGSNVATASSKPVELFDGMSDGTVDAKVVRDERPRSADLYHE